MRTLGAIVYPKFELLDLYGPLEMFGTATDDFRIVTLAEHDAPVASTQGPKTTVDHTFAEAPDLDLLLLPGGIGTLPELENPAMLDFLRERAPRAERVMSVCTGSALLAKAGLLDGRRATTNKMFFEIARRQPGDVTWVEQARWVIDGPYATSSGVSAGTDMALAVIEELLGTEAAEQIAVFTEYQWHRDADNDPFAQYLNKGELPA
ncbi:MAG: DJ-1/PfpI family protein [Pseudomonadota bacterium]